MQHLAIQSAALFVLLIAAGCTRSPTSRPYGPGASKPTAPKPLTYDQVRADVKAAVGKRVVWRGKLLEWLGKEDLVSNKVSKYYLLLAENPERQGEYTESRPFLLVEEKLARGSAAENAVRIEQGQKIIILATSKWHCRPCNDIILTVTGTIDGEMEYHAASEKLPSSAPLISSVTIDLATDK